MRLTVLGAAAGGGFPQWNCGCDNCVLARAGASNATPRTQDSLATSADGDAWLLVNASPDLPVQVARAKALHPRGPRSTPIRGVVLTNGDLDHVLGLFSLRESTPIVVYATATVRRGLEQNAMLRTLQRFDGQLTFVMLESGRAIDAFGLRIVPFSLPGKLPKHLEGHGEPSPEDAVGLDISASGHRAVIASSAAALGDWTSRLEGADVAVIDGTFWSSDELVQRGLGTARAEDMAHLPVGGPNGSLVALGERRGRLARRTVYGHINNTNPMILEGSVERRAVESAGFEVAFDGMDLT